MKKSFNPQKGIKVKTVFNETKHTPHKKHRTPESQERIDICLSCTKPASECKGKCFGGV